MSPMVTSTDLCLSDLVREAARRQGLTHQALADVVGLARVPFSDRMRGRTPWSVSELTALARVLDLDLYALLDSATDGDEVLAS